jgi:hypothetical protein
MPRCSPPSTGLVLAMLALRAARGSGPEPPLTAARQLTGPARRGDAEGVGTRGVTAASRLFAPRPPGRVEQGALCTKRATC